MARYLSRHGGGRRGRTRRRLYIISAMLIIAASYCVYRIAIRNTHPGTQITPEASTDTNSALLPLVPRSEEELEPNLSEIAPEPTSEPNPQAAKLITEAMALLDAKPARIIDARDRLNETLPMPMSRQQRNIVKKQLSELADKWLFSRVIFPQDRLCSVYKVKAGDQLRTIGKLHKVPHEILLQINKITRPEALQAGETIKVINGPFHTRIYRSTFTMDLYLQNTFVRSFPVGLGRESMETPTGLWSVKPAGKLITPTWTDPITGKTYEAEDPDYPLGSRWIGLKGVKGEAKGRTGFAIHGTKVPNEIGTTSSQGCIRLHNGNAILLYNLLVPSYSRVEIVE